MEPRINVMAATILLIGVRYRIQHEHINQHTEADVSIKWSEVMTILIERTITLKRINDTTLNHARDFNKRMYYLRIAILVNDGRELL